MNLFIINIKMKKKNPIHLNDWIIQKNERKKKEKRKEKKDRIAERKKERKKIGNLNRKKRKEKKTK